MIAADTNVVVRLLVNDDPGQTARARRLFETETIYLPKTVLLETEWVLRRLYRLASQQIIRSIDLLISLPNVEAEDEPLLRQALAWNQNGMDFADALHLASSRRATRFATFDRALIKAAPPTGLPVSEP